MEHGKSSTEQAVEVVDGVELTQLAAGENTSVQLFEIEPGSIVPEHDHPHEQAGYLFEGTAVFRGSDGSETVVEAGDGYVLAGGETHAVENTGETMVRGVDVFSPPRDDPDWGE
ncbi:MAG: cupin domain-containing protein [Natronomonas sp.]